MAPFGQSSEVIQNQELKIGKQESATENDKTSESTLLGKRKNPPDNDDFDPNVD
jgi:hypothetical protein